jgi:hypothetical protein
VNCRFLASLGMTVLGANALTAQSIELSGSAFMVQNNLLFTNARAEQTGQFVAAEGALRISKLRVGLASAMGSLAGDDDALNPDRSGRSTTITALIQATPWMGLGAAAEAKRFDSDAGITVWRLIGGNVRLTPMVIPNTLEALADVSVWPSATILNGPTMGLALRSVVGATYFVKHNVGIRLAYRFERFDFEDQGGAPRLEQYRGATLGAVYRLSR